jgi:hypothetical protein
MKQIEETIKPQQIPLGYLHSSTQNIYKISYTLINFYKHFPNIGIYRRDIWYKN